MEIHFDLRWVCDNNPSQEITAELFRLLQTIHDLGSLRAAAAECALSYRHAWGLLQKWERLAGHPLVLLERGRGADLAPLGQKLIEAHKRIRASMEPKFASMASD
ncbi:MAG: winged helix-turn-helix domain-containing protein, partial [Methylococcales bacterium]